MLNQLIKSLFWPLRVFDLGISEVWDRFCYINIMPNFCKIKIDAEIRQKEDDLLI